MVWVEVSLFHYHFLKFVYAGIFALTLANFFYLQLLCFIFNYLLLPQEFGFYNQLNYFHNFFYLPFNWWLGRPYVSRCPWLPWAMQIFRFLRVHICFVRYNSIASRWTFWWFGFLISFPHPAMYHSLERIYMTINIIKLIIICNSFIVSELLVVLMMYI